MNRRSILSICHSFFLSGLPVTLSSVVNLTGKTGDVNNFRFGAGANLLSAHSFLEVPLRGIGSLVFSIRRSYTDILKSPLYNDIYDLVTGDEETGIMNNIFQQRPMGGGGGFGGRNPNIFSGTTSPDFYFYDINSKLTLNPTTKDILSLSIYNGKDHLDKSQDFGDFNFRMRGSAAEISNDLSLSTSDITQWGNSGICGKWSRQWHDRLYSHVSLANSVYTSIYDRNTRLEGNLAPTDTASFRRGLANITEEDNKVKDMTFRFDNEIHVSNSHHVNMGVHLANFRTEYNSSMNDTTRILERNTEGKQAAFYVQERWKIGNMMELNLGLRTTYYDPTGSQYYEPRTSFTFSFPLGIKIKGAWGQYYQFVNRIINENVLEGSRDFWLLADDELKPGFSEHKILGISFEDPDYILDIEGYCKNIDNLLEYSRRFNTMADYNNRFFIGMGTAKGIEFLAQKKRGDLTG